MPIPDYQTIMLPLLRIAEDGETHSIHEAVEKLAEHFSLSEQEQSKLLPSGKQPVFYNRVSWARTYLKKARLLTYPKRGRFRITERGQDVLEDDPEHIDNQYLKKFEEFVEFRKRSGEQDETEAAEDSLDELTPEEALEKAYQQIRSDLADELIDYVLRSTHGFFEKLVVDLLVNMGYGGSHRNAARAVGKSGDAGIDGIIDEDRLGLDNIYIQAKKWEPDNTVSRPEIQKFVGALQGQKAKKGIFITTSGFSSNARNYAKMVDTKVILINGQRLAELMIDHNVGVSVNTMYEIKNLDSDYFGEILKEE